APSRAVPDRRRGRRVRPPRALLLHLRAHLVGEQALHARRRVVGRGGVRPARPLKQVVAASATTRPARLAPARPRHYPTAATLRAEETHDRSHARGHRLRAPRGARLPAAARVQPPRPRARPRPLRRALPVVGGRPRGLLARDGRTAALDDALPARPRLAAAVRA